MIPPGATFQFGLPLAPWLAVILLLALAAVGVAFWWPRLARVGGGRRRLLVALRVAALVLVALLVLDPQVVRRRDVQSDDYVVVLLDDSRSMRIETGDGQTRGDRLRAAWTADRDTFIDKLRKRHHVALYRFGAAPARVAGPEALSFDAAESDPAGAIRAAVRDLAGARVASAILFSDGVAQGAAADAEPADAAPVAGVPVQTVAVGSPEPWRDLEIRAVSAQRTHFEKEPVAVTVDLGAEGLAGRRAAVELAVGGRVVDSKTLDLADDPQESRVRLQFTPETEGWLTGEARVRLMAGGAGAAAAPERVLQNNTRRFVIDTRPKVHRILYLSGRPNWENKFVHRVLEGDPELRLSSLIRISGPMKRFEFRGGQTALANPLFQGLGEDEAMAPRWDEAVFIRLGLGPSELAKGYPQTEEALFPYDLVIWGDIDADYFSPLQLELTRDFVSQRGGAFLMLGGPRAFSEGHYAGTMVEQMLPVALGTAPRTPRTRPEGTLAALFRARPTAEGFISGAAALETDPARNDALWSGLPDLYGFNTFPLVRVGATVLARAEADPDAPPAAMVPEGATSGEGAPLLAWQRYGLGRTAVLATGETWQWKMEREPDDTTHQRFWRQLVRSLVADVPTTCELRSGGDALTAGAPGRLEFLVRDGKFRPRDGLNVSVKARPATGPAFEIPTEESLREPGVYVSNFTPEAPGTLRLELTARDAEGREVSKLEQGVSVQPDLREYRNAAANDDYLKRMARASGGHFYTLDQLDQIPDAIPETVARKALMNVRHLWEWPGWYIALALMWGLEWALRRRRGEP